MKNLRNIALTAILLAGLRLTAQMGTTSFPLHNQTPYPVRVLIEMTQRSSDMCGNVCFYTVPNAIVINPGATFVLNSNMGNCTGNPILEICIVVSTVDTCTPLTNTHTSAGTCCLGNQSNLTFGTNGCGNFQIVRTSSSWIIN